MIDNRIWVLSLICVVTLSIFGAVSKTPLARAQMAPLSVKINFQPDAFPVPAGYTKDIGLAYLGTRGFGWVREDSLAGVHVPLDISPNTRDRAIAGVDPRLNTIIHLQYPLGVLNATAVKIPAAWEYDLPNGTYTVLVSVGDKDIDSTHRINVEGINVIDNFKPTVDNKFFSATKTITVTDGKLTLDAIGGTNTKLNYLEITGQAVTPPTPTPTPTPTPVPSSLSLKVNFQNDSAPVPAGYVRDFGEAYGLRTGADQGSGQTFGWVTPGTHTPASLVGKGRDRNRVGVDQRLDTLIHMQQALNAAWELKIPNGTYSITVAVGDQPGYDSRHVITIEGSTAINYFVGSVAKEYETVTVPTRVTDGLLTVDAIRGQNTKINYIDIVSDTSLATRPSVTSSTPINGQIGVLRNIAITADVFLPNVGSGVDASSLTVTTVRLVKAVDGSVVPANRNTSGGGDVIVLQPTVLLDALTEYRLEINGVKDLSGKVFMPYSVSFTTGTEPTGTSPSTIQFQKVPLGTSTGKNFTSLVIGPDRKLYAGTIDGFIYRFTINGDGSLGAPEIITSLRSGGSRMLIGLAFDPSSTASNLILWTSHSTFGFNDMPDWGGKITRLSGPNLATVQDYVTDLPRSIRDHVTNSLAFGPDGALYVLQGSNSAMGEGDNAWGLRPERLLTASLLRINIGGIASPPINVRTEEGGSYNPLLPTAPVKIYASGIRNAFDLLWHSNGSLYVPTNGSASGGNTPATPAILPTICQNRLDDAVFGDYTGPQVPGLTNVSQTQNDYLYRVVSGGYYGHPNPKRCEWVLNGGNPTASIDQSEVVAYPVNLQPDRNWKRFVFDFGQHFSPNGVIEYKSNSFGGALKGKLLVTRYSAGDDVIVLTPGGSGDISGNQTGLPGLTSFIDPLDLIEDTITGNIYISEYGGQKITLLKPN